MNFYKNNQVAAILKLIKISKNCHSRFTVNYPKFFSSHSVHRKCNTILHPSFYRFERFEPLAALVHIYMILLRFSSTDHNTFIVGINTNTGLCDKKKDDWDKGPFPAGPSAYDKNKKAGTY